MVTKDLGNRPGIATQSTRDWAAKGLIGEDGIEGNSDEEVTLEPKWKRSNANLMGGRKN